MNKEGIENLIKRRRALLFYYNLLVIYMQKKLSCQMSPFG